MPNWPRGCSRPRRRRPRRRCKGRAGKRPASPSATAVICRHICPGSRGSLNRPAPGVLAAAGKWPRSAEWRRIRKRSGGPFPRRRSERLDVIPAQFRVLVTRRPNGGHDCHWFEGMPDGPPPLLAGRRASACARACRARRAAHGTVHRLDHRREVRGSSAVLPSGRSTLRPRSSNGRGSISTGARLATGSVVPAST